MKSKVLVTGADGFIGSHLVEKLVSNGENVRAFVAYNSFGSWGWLDNVDEAVKKSIEVFSGDVRDPHGVAEAMIGCDMVFHLAALIAIPYSYHSPSTYIDTNITGTLNVLQAAKRQGNVSVVQTSTSEVYGSAQYVPIDELHPLKGQSPYSASKIGADQMAYSYFASFDLPVKLVRPFNTYGPRQSARAVIPSIIIQLAAGNEKINLGSLYPTRDFSYVADTVLGFIAVSKGSKGFGEVVNLASNFEISIGDTVNLISSIMEKNVTVEEEQQRLRPKNSEVNRLFGANKKAKELFSWEPKVSGLPGFEEGLRKTISWFTNPKNLSHYKADRYNL